MRRTTLMLVALAGGMASPALAQTPSQAVPPRAPEFDQAKFGTRIEALDHTWAGHRATPAIVMVGNHQVVGYYDAERQLTVAHRQGLGTPWRYHKLPSWLGWDSHNSVALGVDEAGYIHVMANMHADPLVYFRSAEPWDVRTLQQHSGLMNDAFEKRVTNPYFMNDASGRLIAKFRSGGSGNGVELYHRYDPTAGKWARMHGGPLVDGEGERSGYFLGPIKGPDDYYHLVWVWRDTPSADTNHDLSYARSRDLERWETSEGKPLTLPIRFGAGEVIEPVAPGGGFLNGQYRLGFDAAKRPMITYFKYDAKGDTQIFLLRKTDGGWRSSQVSSWTGSRMPLDRQGSLNKTITVSDAPRLAADGTILVRATRDGRVNEWRVDPRTTKVLGERFVTDALPAAVEKQRVRPDLLLHVVSPRVTAPTGTMGDHDWYLTWQTLPDNQDIAREEIPAASTLKLVPVPKAK